MYREVFLDCSETESGEKNFEKAEISAARAIQYDRSISLCLSIKYFHQ